MEWQPPADRVDPLNDYDLLQQRWRQRRQLLLIRDWVVEGYGKEVGPAPPIPNAIRRHLLEQLLRDIADKEIERLTDFLQQEQELVGLAELYELLAQSQSKPWLGRGPHPFAEERRSGEQARKDIQEAPKDVDGESLTRLVAALVWADDLANDGYRDSRLPTLPNK